MEHNFKKYINDVLEFKQYNCVETVPLPELSSIVSLCKLMEHFTFKNLANEIPPGLSPEDYEYLINIWFLFWCERLRFSMARNVRFIHI